MDADVCVNVLVVPKRATVFVCAFVVRVDVSVAVIVATEMILLFSYKQFLRKSDLTKLLGIL